MKAFILLLNIFWVAISFAQQPVAEKYVSSKTHISFLSHTAVEDIQANNTASIGTLEPLTGAVVFSVPMQSFEFEKALMQKHYNSDKFLDTKQFPKAKFTGIILNLSDIDFSKDGKYQATVEGEMTLKGQTKPIKESGTIVVKGNTIELETTFNLTLADYGINFVNGKPASNIAKTIEINFTGEYQPQ
jgi:polyisoprenoid-binding protein YceI